jgi:hypothetical protein
VSGQSAELRDGIDRRSHDYSTRGSLISERCSRVRLAASAKSLRVKVQMITA